MAVYSYADEVIVENVCGFTQSTKIIHSSGSDVIGWGVVCKESQIYSSEGKSLKHVPGGTLIEHIGIKTSSIGDMSKCRIWENSSWNGPFLIQTYNVLMFQGTRENVDRKDVDDICRYFSLVQNLENRKKDLNKKAAMKNPYYEKFKETAEKYNALSAKSEELTAKRDSTNTSEKRLKGKQRKERGNVIAELNKMKVEETKLQNELKIIQQKYEEWNKEHNSSGIDFTSDAEYMKLSKQILELKKRLIEIGLEL